MLSKVFRSIAQGSKRGYMSTNNEYNINRSLSIIQDNENYTKEKIFRVIRCYYLISFDSKKMKTRKVWGQDSLIQESVRKLTPLVKELDPNSLFLLILNAALLNIMNQALWKNLEASFIKFSHVNMQPSQIASICEAFQSVKRKSSEVWGILAYKLLNEVYSSGQLDAQDVAKALRGFAVSGLGSDELISKLVKNLKDVLTDIQTLDLFIAVDGLTLLKNRDEEVLVVATEKLISLISISNQPRYFLLLRLLLRTDSFEVIDKVEQLFRSQYKDEKYSQLCSLLLLYSTDRNLGNPKRVDFVKELVEYLISIRHDAVNERGNAYELTLANSKVIFLCIKLNIEYPAEDVVKCFRDLKQIENTSKGSEEIISKIEEYLKEKKTI